MKEIIVSHIHPEQMTYRDEQYVEHPIEPLTAYLVPIGNTTEHLRYVTDKNNVISKQSNGKEYNIDTVARTIEVTTTDLGVETEEEVTEQMIADYFNSLNLVKSENEFYIIKVIIPPINFDIVGDWVGNGVTDAVTLKNKMFNG